MGRAPPVRTAARSHDGDRGYWPRKNTNFLVHGLPYGFKLPMCKLDCEHLVHRGGEKKHKKVICVNPTNWREQEVITDPMEKGRIPHGVFNLIMFGHRAWHLVWGTARVSPVLFEGPEGPRHA